MKVGIIVYSKTGNTLQVAERIRAALVEVGLQAEVQRFSAETENAQSNTPVRLTAQPDPNGYDALIIGAPVQAFSLDPAMTMYLKQIGALQNVPTLCFITQHFKKAWMGGNRAMKQLLEQLQEKGAPATATGVVNWTSEQREAQIDLIVRQCVKVLTRQER